MLGFCNIHKIILTVDDLFVIDITFDLPNPNNFGNKGLFLYILYLWNVFPIVMGPNALILCSAQRYFPCADLCISMKQNCKEMHPVFVYITQYVTPLYIDKEGLFLGQLLVIF